MTKRIAVVGCGDWGKNLVRNFHTLRALHTICSSRKELRQHLAGKYPGVQGASDFTEVLRDPETDGVALATPAATHASLTRDALLAGKDVFVEKPLCLSVQEGGELVELAREKNRILMVGHILWYHPAVLKLKELIDSGRLGRVQYIYSNRLNMGRIKQEENVLWSLAPHDISVILGLTREMPESVRAQGGNFSHQKVADTSVTLLNFASGIRAYIFVSRLHPFKEQKLVIVGDRGTAVFEDTLPWEEKLGLYPHTIDKSGDIPTAGKAEAEPVKLRQEEPLKSECAHFLECSTSRRTPRTDGEEGLRVLQVLEACQQSLEQEKKIVPNC
ncbi:MAG: Gfo/Idh/MocA family protein [Desulfurivibrionaceae bacterium]